MREKGETLTELELGRLKPVRGEGGRSRRAFCPFHGSDQQRSLRIDQTSGRFQCFACGAWGYMDWARQQFQDDARALRPSRGRKTPLKAPVVAPIAASVAPAERPQPPTDWSSWLAEYQDALPGSPGAEYLEERRIPLALAQQLGIGYAPPGRWAHRSPSGTPLRDWKYGRLVFPHTSPPTPENPSGLVNLYGRALGDSAPKSIRHDHLPGPKGYFNFPALTAAATTAQPLLICEGPFDALSLIAATGSPHAVAIFGVNGWRWDWSIPLRQVIFAMDADPAGDRGWRQIARSLALRGKRVQYLEPALYGGAKDCNEAWVNSSLDLENLKKALFPENG